MFVTFRLLLSFWFRKMALAGCLETWHWGRGMTCSQAEEKADSWAKNRGRATCYLFVSQSENLRWLSLTQGKIMTHQWSFHIVV